VSRAPGIRAEAAGRAYDDKSKSRNGDHEGDPKDSSEHGTLLPARLSRAILSGQAGRPAEQYGTSRASATVGLVRHRGLSPELERRQLRTTMVSSVTVPNGSVAMFGSCLDALTA
jgi:hypothetical protein